MVKIKLFTAFVIFVSLAVCSCTKEEQSSDEVTPPCEEVSVIYASLDQMNQGTKTYFGGKEYKEGKGYYQVLWDVGDSLHVANKTATKGATFRLTSGAGSMYGVFENVGDGTVSNDGVYALYPKSCLNAQGKTLWRVKMPVVQKMDPSGKSFAKNVYPEYASADSLSGTLKFKSLMSVLKLNLYSGQNRRVRRITVSSGDNQQHALSGFFRDTMSTGGVGVDPADATNNYVELLCDPPKELTSDSNNPDAFHIVLPPKQYDSLTVSIETVKDGKARLMIRKIKNSVSCKLSADTVRNMQALSVDVSDDAPVPHYIEHKYGNYSDSTDYGEGVFVAGLFWAPENCGIKEDEKNGGLLYQWGRKYGQSVDMPMEHVLPHKLTFDQGQDYQYAGYFSPGPGDNSVWWSEQSFMPDETIWSAIDRKCNPCPEGWYVPSNDEFETFKKNVNKTKDDNNVYVEYGSHQLVFKRIKNRERDGELVTRDYSSYWTRTRDNFNGLHQYSFGTTPFGRGSASIPTGFSVRCVHDPL